MNDLETGWFAGLYEGEGSCGVYAHRKTHRAKISLASTDRDVVERFQDLAGVGSITQGYRPQRPPHRAPHLWQVANARDVLHVCRLLRPHMGERRAAQMDPVIAFCEDRIAHPRKPGPPPGMGGRPRGR